ncbi:hypothetical protein [Streptomyces sp. NPDC055186]
MLDHRARDLLRTVVGARGHGLARRGFPGGEQVVEDRLAEERAAEETLAALDGMDTGDPEFVPRLFELRKDVREHARAEERSMAIRRRKRKSTDRRGPDNIISVPAG